MATVVPLYVDSSSCLPLETATVQCSLSAGLKVTILVVSGACANTADDSNRTDTRRFTGVYLEINPTLILFTIAIRMSVTIFLDWQIFRRAITEVFSRAGGRSRQGPDSRR